MHDIDIWRRLESGVATPADLAEVAALPLGRRCAYVGAGLRLVAHAEPLIRAAALGVLAGSRGFEGVRAIVAALDDKDETVRIAALAALRETSRDAPARFAHALFHPRPDIRRAALAAELPEPIAELATYLRTDPTCADLAALRGRWPTECLPLLFGLYGEGHLPAAELVAVASRHGAANVRAYLERAHRRAPEAIDAYLDRARRSGLATLGAPAGTDTIDLLAAALAACPPDPRDLEWFAETVTGKRAVARRAVASVLAQLVRAPDHAQLWGVCVALDPRILAITDFPTAHVDAIIEALLASRSHRPTDEQIEKLLALPLVQADLALTAAVVSRAAAGRMRLLIKVRGEDAIIESLLASDRGWREIATLPHETPALDIALLARVEQRDYKRYIALGAITIRTFHGTRRELFLEQLPRRHRPAMFETALIGAASESDDKVLALCRLIAPRVDRVGLVAIMPELLDRDPTGRLALGIVRYVPDNVLGGAARDFSVRHVTRLVELLDKDPAPRDRELVLAKAFTERGIVETAEWCTRVNALLTATVVAEAPIVRTRRELTAREERLIQGAPIGKSLDLALAPALGGCVSGLVRALERPTTGPHIWACVTLLSCADRLEDVAHLLDRYSEPTAAFDANVDNAIASMARFTELPVLARARLWRWEHHQFAFLDWVDSCGGALAALQLADSLRRRFACATLWQAISEGLMLLRYRALPRFQSQASLELALYCAERVDQPIGRHAARIVVALVEAGVVPVSAVRDKVLDRVADADGETRSYVARLIRLEGVPEVPQALPPPPVNVVDDIRTSSDLDSLAAWCLDPRPAIVQEAALALVALGPAGQLRLAEVLAGGALVTPVPILATVVLWDHEPAIDRLRGLAAREDLDPSWQFHLAIALLYRGEQNALPRALAAIRSTSESWYFRRADWDALVGVADVVKCSLALTDAPHHHAYQRAVTTLLSLTRPTTEVHDALVRFLEIDSDRPLWLRMSTARYIARHWEDMRGMPILVEEACDPNNISSYTIIENTPDAAIELLMRTMADASLIGGQGVCPESRMWWCVDNIVATRRAPATAAADIFVRILESSSDATSRRHAAQRVISAGQASARVRRVAEVFAWGVRRGAELAGRLFSFHMTSSEKEFGHTRLDSNRIFVSALPMLRDETNGRDIVEGLVLHEIGHHVYHSGEPALALWKRAHAEGIGHFLNLIADEHLERNLRAVAPAYGDRLKRLGAYAFHHAPQEMKVTSLRQALGAATAIALIAADFGVAHDAESIRLKRGAVLAELDRAGHPVARFSRSLRMGLGNRAGDPLNAAALAVCGKELRALDMQGLYDLTRQLVTLFGGRVEIAKVFGGPEGLAFGERDDNVYGAGIDDDILQREIERILEPGSSEPGSSRGSRLAINVNPSTFFHKITKVVRVETKTDREVHRQLANQVARHSTRLRGYLDELGLRWEPARARTQGRAIDKTRLRALVTRNDPRILIARTPIRKTDLFVGTIVDCSGSMQARDNIGRAKRFAVLVAEAVRHLPGVEARFFGFTESVIYDAGTKTDCHVAALQAGGGNNDAAGLYYAANIAMAAPQRAKILIMISDGLPTDCSVAALRNLVTELTRRRGIVCAQVGVIQLEEICFPHYVLIDDDQLDVAVAKFGRMIAELARRSLAS